MRWWLYILIEIIMFSCFLFFAESTHGVDGPLLWRLTLDQDLLDTLTRRFPSWFDNNSGSSSIASTSDSGFVSSSSPAAEQLYTVSLAADPNGMAEGKYFVYYISFSKVFYDFLWRKKIK